MSSYTCTAVIAALVLACGAPARAQAPVNAAQPVDLDSLVTSINAQVDTLPVLDLPPVEREIREWLGRLQFEDESLLPPGEDPEWFYRIYRGQLLDALGWAGFRRGDLRQAEAALTSAVAEINSRGTTTGYARHFMHLGDLYARQGRWDLAIDAYVDAEARGLGAEATPALESAYQRRYGSLRGLDSRRSRERARIEDERLQKVVAGSIFQELPDFTYARRTGAPLQSGTLVGDPLVVAIWDASCGACDDYAEALADLGDELRARGGALVGIWLGDDPATAGPPQRYHILVSPDPAATREKFKIDVLPLLMVVDARGWIRYRHSGLTADPPPTANILVQLDHLKSVGR